MEDNDADIKNLNSPMKYTKEEKTQVQKKFFFLLIILLLIIVFYFIFLFYLEDIKGFFSSPKEKVTEIEESEDEEALYNQKDGSININNVYIQELYNRLYLDYNEYYIFDSSLLYNAKVTDLTDQNKLFLISKTKKFHNLVDENNNFFSKDQLCQNPIYIDKKSIEEIAQNNFNIMNINHTNFKIVFVKENVFLSYMEFKYEENRYVGNCIDYQQEPLSKVATSIISNANKEGEYIHIDLKTIFQTQNGIYKDINLKTKISDTYKEENELNYYNLGSTYRITYKYNGNKDYYLEKITLID